MDISRRYYLIGVALLILITFLRVADAATLSGKITDETSGMPIVGITIWLENTNFYAVSDSGGNYLITDIPDDVYTVIIDGPDYQQRVYRNFGVGTAAGLLEFQPHDIPDQFIIRQNYPNPFNPETTISYFLPIGVHVRLEVRDMLGRKIKTLVESWQSRGTHTVSWDGYNANGSRVSSGVYYYKIQANEWREIRKMVFLQ